ncbi:MAG TPA: helix-turn-helix transcriptional regulator [Polyangiaceae bacterium]
MEALGGTRALATECGVSTWTVRAWLSGERTPTPLSQERIDELARRLELPAPYASRPPSLRRKLDG